MTADRFALFFGVHILMALQVPSVPCCCNLLQAMVHPAPTKVVHFEEDNDRNSQQETSIHSGIYDLDEFNHIYIKYRFNVL